VGNSCLAIIFGAEKDSTFTRCDADRDAIKTSSKKANCTIALLQSALQLYLINDAPEDDAKHQPSIKQARASKASGRHYLSLQKVPPIIEFVCLSCQKMK